MVEHIVEEVEVETITFSHTETDEGNDIATLAGICAIVRTSIESNSTFDPSTLSAETKTRYTALLNTVYSAIGNGA